jgi:hypothetical protein
MAARRRGGGGWSLILFFAAWVGLVLCWIVAAPSAGTAMTVVKVLVLIPGLIGLAVAAVLAFVVRKLGGAVEGIKAELLKGMGPEIDEAARKLVDLQEALFDRPHEYRRADPAEFDRLDARYYDDTRAWLEAQGFEHLGDVENLTLSAAMPNLRTFLRVMAGDGGAVTAAVYQVRLDPPVTDKPEDETEAEDEGADEASAEGAIVRSGAGPDDDDDEDEDDPEPRRLDVLEFETELEGGTFLVTNALKDSDDTADVEGIDKARLPRETPRETLLAEHRRRLAAAGAARLLTTFDEVMASQARLQELKCVHQRRVGYFNQEALSKTAGGGSSLFAEQIAKRAKEIYAERHGAAGARG